MKKLSKKLLLLLFIILLTLIIVGGFSSNAIQNGGVEHTTEWQGELMKINDENIRFIQKGSGQNVLLIHGTPGTIEDWQTIIDQLSKNYKVTAYDRYGNGFSTANNYNYTIDENVALANNIIEKLGLDSVVVVGHSYGGSTTTQLATMDNDKIKSFIAVAPPLYDFELDLNYRIMSTPLIGKGIATVVSKTVATSLIKDGLTITFGTNGHLLTDDFVQIRKTLWSQSKVLYTTSNERKNYNAGLMKNAVNYKNITQKITFMVGEHDAPHIVEDFYRMKKDLPSAEFVFLENTAHFIQFEATDRLMAVILEHLE